MYIFFCRLTIGLVLESHTMVASCVAYGCTERKGNNPNVSFHRFLHNDQEQLQKWIQAIRRKDWVPTKHSWNLFSPAFHSTYRNHLPKESLQKKGSLKKRQHVQNHYHQKFLDSLNQIMLMQEKL